MNSSKRATQADVAKRAGVSRGTVSLVLNGADTRIPISEETRARVLQAADELGYTPNPVAQMLVQGSNRLIGVFTYEAIFPFDRNDFFFPYLTGIQREASVNDYNVLLFTRSHRIFSNTMNSLLLADGSILLGGSPDRAELARLSEERYSFVYIGRREVPGHAINWVANDYQMGSYQAAQHLFQLGHTTVAFCGNSMNAEPQHDKLAGCHKAVNEAQGVEFLTIPEDIFKDRPNFLRALHDNHITALLCSDNNAFYSVLSYFYEQGIRVPEDISVVCLTSIEHSLPYPHLPSFVQLNRPTLGQVAVQTLIKLMNGEFTDPQQIYIPCEFVAGGTTSARE
jgi:DNA-binding LacI/PurR family transcriptional regulator